MGLPNFAHVSAEIFQAVNPFVEPRDDRRVILRKFVPRKIGLVVSVVITLNVRRMRAIRLVHHRIDDARAQGLAGDIARRIEKELQYPGQIRVTVIRETRAVDYAK